MDLQQRLTSILTDPKGTWPLIAGEATEIAALYREYIAVLAAIPAVAMFVGMTLFGLPLVGRYGLSAALSASIASYVSALASPLVTAVVIEKLAPRFGSSGSTVDALKLVAYATTPVWIAGVLYVMPPLAPLVALAVLYAIYLYYLGLPHLMKTPPEQAVPFMLVSALAVLVVGLVIAALTSALGAPRYGL